MLGNSNHGAIPDTFSVHEKYFEKSSWWGYRQVLPIYSLWILSLIGIGFGDLTFKVVFAVIASVMAYRMTFILHDTSHGTLFSAAWENRFWGWLSGFCVFVSFSDYRQAHWQHHSDLWEKDDPQAPDYIIDLSQRGGILLHLIKPLFLLNAWEKFNQFVTLQYAEAPRAKKKQKASLLPLIGIFAAQFFIFWITTGFFKNLWAYPFFIILMVSIGLFLSRLRSYLEHGILDSSTRSGPVVRTHEANWFERRVLTALAFHFHIEHHAWPHIPSRHLESVRREYQSASGGESGGTYFSSILKLIRNWLSTSPSLKDFQSAPEIKTETVACGLCAGSKSVLHSESYDFEYLTSKNKWQFNQCLECENLYLSPRPDRSELNVIYPTSYYSYNYDKKFGIIARTGKSILDRITFSKIQKLVPLKIKKYLDIGCGNGRYLKLLRKQGLSPQDLYGLELDAKLVERLRSEGLSQVFHSTFEEAHELPRESFQLITLFSVLEHMANPREALKRIRDLLEDDGMVVFEVPNSKSLNHMIFKDYYWGAYHTPRHWNIFSVDTVRKIADELGFKIRFIRRSTGHAFWLLSIHHFLTYRLGFKRIGKIFHPEKCLWGVLIATAVDLVRGKFGAETDNMIIFLQKSQLVPNVQKLPR